MVVKQRKKDTVSNLKNSFSKEYLLYIIFFVVLGIRIFFAFQSFEFSDDSAYFTMRQIESIKENGLPIFDDELNTQRNNMIIHPAYYYILTFFSFFMPVSMVLKIIPNIFASMTIFAIYLISMKFTKSQEASLFAASLSGFIPVFFLKTFNSGSIYSLVIPLLLISVYSFLMLNTNKKFIYPYLISILFLSFTHPVVFLVLISLLLFMLISFVENIRHQKLELEAIIVSLIVILWSQFLIFKKAFLMFGTSVIWQNTPSEIMSVFFRQINILEAIGQIGIIPCLAGAFIFFQYVKDKKSKMMFFALSFTLPVFALLWFKMINPKSGLILLAAFLSIILGKYYQDFNTYIKKTKFYVFRVPLIITILIIIYFTSILPTFAWIEKEINLAPNTEKIITLKWLEENSHNDSVVLGMYEDGFLIQHHSKRKTIIDSHFISLKNAEKLMEDVTNIYTSFSVIEVIKLLDKYNISHIFVSEKTRNFYGLEENDVFNNKKCFDIVYQSKLAQNKIYRVKCSLKNT